MSSIQKTYTACPDLLKTFRVINVPLRVKYGWVTSFPEIIIFHVTVPFALLRWYLKIQTVQQLIL